jgi:alpha-tubulin suppressor-like RCC1 family protein
LCTLFLLIFFRCIGNDENVHNLEDGTISGQLGQKNKIKSFPEIVDFKIEEKIISVSTGNCHTVLLTEKGNLYTAGSNESGQNGRRKASNSFEIIKFIDEVFISSVSCGQHHSIAQTNTNNVFVWG